MLVDEAGQGAETPSPVLARQVKLRGQLRDRCGSRKQNIPGFALSFEDNSLLTSAWAGEAEKSGSR